MQSNQAAFTQTWNVAFMSTSEEEFIHTTCADELGTRVNPCVEIVAFTDASLEDGPHQGLLNFYEAFRRRFGAQMKWYKTNTDTHFKKTTPLKLDMVPFWFEDPRNKAEVRLGVAFKPGSQPKDMQLPAFKFNCSRTMNACSGVFHMCLPLQVGYETLEGMLPLVNEALRDFPLVSGYVGYTVYWDTLDFRFEKSFFEQNMARLYMRHPGIGLADPWYLIPDCLEGLVGISWLTLLGPKVLAQVGGMDALKQKLAAPITVDSLACKGGGALICAGPRPLIGDLDAGDDLPLYKQVGHAVRDARFPRTFYGAGLAKPIADGWFKRFFGE